MKAWMLFSAVRMSCGLGGNVIRCCKPTSPLPYANWRDEVIRPEESKPTLLIGYPAAIGLFFAQCLTLHMWFYNLILKFCGYKFNQWTKATCKLIIPKEKVTWKDSFQDSFDKDNPVTRTYQSSYDHRAAHPFKRQLLLSSMMMLGSLIGHSDTFQLRADVALRKELRSFRSKLNGGLDTNRVAAGPLRHALNMKIQETDQTFKEFTKYNPNTHSAVIDTGASWTAVPNKELCVPGSIRKLEAPIELDGIAGGLMIEQAGKLKAETIDRHGNVFSFETTVMIHEDLPGILISPQALLKDQKGNLDDHFRVYYDRVEWHARGKHLLDVPYDSSFLPRMTFFKEGEAEASLKAFHSALHDSNKNLTPHQKTWLRWHTKLGHLSFSHIQKLAIGGYFDKLALGLSQLKPSDHPQCEACKYGKQTRTPDGINSRTKKHKSVGNLKKGKLTPGHTIFVDQLESRVRGRLLHTAGRERESDMFCGSTVFCDAASGFIHIEHQVTLNASDTINAKTAFE